MVEAVVSGGGGALQTIHMVVPAAHVDEGDAEDGSGDGQEGIASAEGGQTAQGGGRAGGPKFCSSGEIGARGGREKQREKGGVQGKEDKPKEFRVPCEAKFYGSSGR